MQSRKRVGVGRVEEGRSHSWVGRQVELYNSWVQRRCVFALSKEDVLNCKRIHTGSCSIAKISPACHARQLIVCKSCTCIHNIVYSC